MPLFKGKTPEELARETAEKERRQAEAESRRQAEQVEKERQAFLKSPVGMARAAFDRGDLVFQYSIDVMNQAAIIVAMIGSATSHKTIDSVEVLNAICREGWDLVSGDFVFVEEGQQSRDKFMSSGQTWRSRDGPSVTTCSNAARPTNVGPRREAMTSGL
jgi:hypothetical protein